MTKREVKKRFAQSSGFKSGEEEKDEEQPTAAQNFHPSHLSCEEEQIEHEGLDSLLHSEEPGECGETGRNSETTNVGAFAVSHQGTVRRRGGEDDTTTAVSELETVPSDPTPPPPTPNDDGAVLVEAHLAQPVEEENERLREELEGLRQVPLAHAETAQVDQNKGKKRRFCFIATGVILVVIIAIVTATAVSLSNRGGDGLSTPAPSTQTPVSSPSTQTPTSSPSTQNQTQPPATANPTPLTDAIGQTLHGKASLEYFGSSISLSREGNIMAVGAHGGRGYVSVYQLNRGLEEWTAMGQFLVGSERESSFGLSLSLNGDGTILCVGFDNDSDGSTPVIFRVYEYSSTTDRWVQLGRDIGLDTGGGQQVSVSLSDTGDIVAVGDDSGSVWLFQYNAGTSLWQQLGQTLIVRAEYRYFGISAVSLSRSGTIVGIGAWGFSENEVSEDQVHVYEYNSTSSLWDPLGNPIIGHIEYGDFAFSFGHSISLDESGLVMAVGAYDSDRVYVLAHDRTTSTWTQRGDTLLGQQSRDDFGYSVSLSGNGNVLAVGSPENQGERGNVGIFQYDTTTKEWIRMGGNSLNGEAEGDLFGSSISLSANGDVVGIGAPENDGSGGLSGSAYVFRVIF